MSNSVHKKILWITRDFPPYEGRGSVMRSLKFVKYLPEYGWQPYVICEKKEKEVDSSLLNELSPHVQTAYIGVETPQMRKDRYKKILSSSVDLPFWKKILYLFYRSVLYNLYAFYQYHVLAPDPSVYWARRACETAAEFHRKIHFHLFLTSGPPFSSFRTGSRLKKHLRIPWVLDFRDGWAGNPLYREKGKWLIRLQNRVLEKRAVKSSDVVLLATEPMHSIYAKRYPEQQSKMVVITNGYDPEDLEGIPRHRTSNDKLRFIFSGTISGKRSPTHFFRALASAVREREDIKSRLEVSFLGKFHYDQKEVLAPLSPIFRAEGMLPHREALRKMAEADVFVLIINTDCGGKTIMSSKIFEYLALQKPILLISKPCAARDLLASFHAKYIADYSDEEQIKNQILELVEDWENGTLKCQYPLHELKKFDRKRLTRVLSQQLDRLAVNP